MEHAAVIQQGEAGLDAPDIAPSWADTPPEALPPGTTLTGRIGAYRGSGDRPLRYRVIEAPSPRGRLVYLHGIESHGAWFLPAAAQLRRQGWTTLLLDRRGSGLNRDDAPGDTPGADALIEDLHRFRRGLGGEPVHLAALSWGGKLAVAAALRYPTDWQSLTLITPGLHARVSVPARDKLKVLLALISRGAGAESLVPVPIRPEMFTTTPRFLRFIRSDPWRLHRVTARFCLATHTLDRLIARAGTRLDVPALLILAERDRIVDNPRVAGVVRRLRPDAAVTEFAGAEHAVQFDHTARLVDEMVRMLSAPRPISGDPP